MVVKIEHPVGRWTFLGITPVFEGGRFAAKVIVDEVFPVGGKIFREGHDALGANAVVVDVDGNERRFPVKPVGYAGDDDWSGLVQAPSEAGLCNFYLEAWSDAFITWEHTARAKVAANQDIELVFQEGSNLYQRWIDSSDVFWAGSGSVAEKLDAPEVAMLTELVKIMNNKRLTPDNRLRLVLSPDVYDLWRAKPIRDLVSPSEKYPLEVQRSLSSFCSWYQFFPRSVGATQTKTGKNTSTIKQGTFLTAAKELPTVKNMGFDVIYVPPIHPIGESFRKGPNNTLDAGPTDPGSPWAVGSKLGGHDTVDPLLGTVDNFKTFVKTARDLDLEVSIDIALQCSPDHPWVKEHPNWFNVRADGTIAYAENPPKKYQDIYPINFDNDPEGITDEILKILRFWIECGVTVFRIDNPHTKPVWFWQYVIADIKATNPEIVWLAEAFTLPALMKSLGLIGYDQSHSYFLWRNNKEELSEFLSQVSGDDAFWYRATLWPTTPDNLTDYLAQGGTAAHAIRAVLAAMGSPTWGIYQGYELVEDCQRQNQDGSHALEHINSEKYEIKVRDWSKVNNFGIRQLITTLNDIRKNHPSCANFHSLKVEYSENDNLICFTRHISGEFTEDGKADTLIVVVNLDPHNAQKGKVYLDWGRLELPEGFKVVDELTQKQFDFGRDFFVDLAPVVDVAHIFHVIR
jgi:starch synthase (maltosyl-transferring)